MSSLLVDKLAIKSEFKAAKKALKSETFEKIHALKGEKLEKLHALKGQKAKVEFVDVCHEEPRENCVEIPIEVCHNEPLERCEKVPKENCVSTQKVPFPNYDLIKYIQWAPKHIVIL